MGRFLVPIALLAFSANMASANDFNGKDWAWSIAAGSGGAAVMGLGLGLVGLTSEDDYTAIATLALLGPIGADLGASGAVYAYGQLTDHKGSFLATLGGGTAGTLVGIGLVIGSVNLNTDLVPFSLLFMALGPAVGATVGYWLSLEDAVDPHPVTSGALIDRSVAGWRWAMPTVYGTATVDGAFARSVPLLGGRW